MIMSICVSGRGFTVHTFHTTTEPLTFRLHAHVETFLKSARGTVPPRVQVHDTVAIGLACELGFALDLAAEEALAALAGDHSVVQTAGLVATDQALLLRVVHRHFLKPAGRYKKEEMYNEYSVFNAFGMTHPVPHT